MEKSLRALGKTIASMIVENEPFELLLVTQSHKHLFVPVRNMIQDRVISGLGKDRSHVKCALIDCASSTR